MRKLIAKVTKEGPAAKDPRKPACCVTVRRGSVAKAILKKPKPAKAKHGVAKASRKGPRKQVYRTAFYTRVFGTAHMGSTSKDVGHGGVLVFEGPRSVGFKGQRHGHIRLQVRLHDPKTGSSPKIKGS